MKKKVVIVGAGTMGLHCAWFLVREGHEVEIIEAADKLDESGCSYGNCGFIVPSHFISLASPAMLKSGLKMMVDRKSPVYLPVWKNIKNIPWFLKFIRAANNRKVLRNAPVLFQLNETSKKLYSDITTEHPLNNGFRKNGLLMASVTGKGFEEEISLTHLAEELGISTKILDTAKLRAIEPDIDFNIAGAVLYESDAHIQPEKHMGWLKTWLEEQGVIIHYREYVSKVEVNKNKIAALQTRKSKYQADEFVLAAGVHTTGLAKLAGLSVPIISGKGYSIDFPVTEQKLRTPVILTEANVAITPFKDKVRLGSGMEFSGTPGQIRYERVQATLDRTRSAIPLFEPTDVRTLPVWEGMRPLSPDGIPYIGRTAKYSNLSIAAGHAMMGMSLGPVSGKIICDLISGNQTDLCFEATDPDRYNSST